MSVFAFACASYFTCYTLSLFLCENCEFGSMENLRRIHCFAKCNPVQIVYSWPYINPFTKQFFVVKLLQLLHLPWSMFIFSQNLHSIFIHRVISFYSNSHFFHLLFSLLKFHGDPDMYGTKCNHIIDIKQRTFTVKWSLFYNLV